LPPGSLHSHQKFQFRITAGRPVCPLVFLPLRCIGPEGYGQRLCLVLNIDL